MYGDAGSMAVFNPLRWSGSITLERAIEKLNKVKNQKDRPIYLKIPSGVLSPHTKFSNCDAAIERLEEAALAADSRAGRPRLATTSVAQAYQQAHDEEIERLQAFDNAKDKCSKLVAELEEIDAKNDIITEICDWMWGDINELAKNNPLRWSGPKSCKQTENDFSTILQGGINNNRPLLVVAPTKSSKAKKCDTAKDAIDYLHSVCPQYEEWKKTYDALKSQVDDAKAKVSEAEDGYLHAQQHVEAVQMEMKIRKGEKPPCPGPIDCSGLSIMAKDYLGLLNQPIHPKYKGALVQVFVREDKFGGADKSSNGHRYDSIPFANGMIHSNMSCQLVHYVHDEHDDFFNLMKKFDFIIVRCNPGQIKADGGDQAKFDQGMRSLRYQGVQVWPSPDVMEIMGAKDALCKIRNLNIGLEDTLAYYDETTFANGFKKTMAFQPRVIKQNRGSAGEGIWILKLKDHEYCRSFGERSCDGSEMLEMMEANDNHSEEHTVDEFIEFCVNGQTAKSGNWASKGVGKYLEGGKAAGGQLVDQRLLPRIVEAKA